MFGNIDCNLDQVQVQVEILGMLNRKIAGALLAEQPENALGLFVHLANDLGGRLNLPRERHTLPRPQ
jgi:hypothetical protein